MTIYAANVSRTAGAQLQLFRTAAQPQLPSKKPRSPQGDCDSYYQINSNFNIRLVPRLQRRRRQR